MSTLNFRHIDFLLPNFSVRKALYPEASASLNSKVGAFNAGANTSNPISFRSGRVRQLTKASEGVSGGVCNKQPLVKLGEFNEIIRKCKKSFGTEIFPTR